MNMKILPLSFLLVAFLSININAQMPNIPPSMLTQISSMSDQERKVLMQQYGIELDVLTNNENNEASQQNNSEEIISQADQVLIDRILKSESNKNIAREFQKRNSKIFESNYKELEDLPVFGEFLFQDEYSTFAPVDNAPVPSNYILGPGDSIKVLMFGSLDSQLELLVNREGEINFPEIGNIGVAGMTFEAASEHIKNRISKQMIGVNANISVGKLKTINIFMAGESKIPGLYSVSGLSTVSQALFVSGGITDIGSLRNIQIRRSGNIVANFDLYELLTKGDASGDVRLQSGDIIFVPVNNRIIYIDGAVKRPGKYEIKDDETLLDLISIAGGYRNRAFLRQVYLESYDGTDIPIVRNLDLTSDFDQRYVLRDGDIIKIAEIGDRLSRSVTLKGAVKRPGAYGWFDGMTFTDVINSINTDFESNFDMSKGLIIRRKNNDNFDIELFDFSVDEAISKPKTEHDPKLQTHDEILIFSLGHNNDDLNNIQIYDPSEDMEHPSYFKNNNLDSSQASQVEMTQNTDVIEDYYKDLYTDEKNNEMTDKELEIFLYESKKQAEYEILNQGKRRILLEPIIKKLYQQASSSESARIISISGAVKVPGDYPLVKNGNIENLIQIAGGYSDNAFTESAELRRKSFDTEGSIKIQTEDIDLNQNKNEKLQSRDHLHVRNIKDWDAKDTVTLMGEVFYPGSYLISPNEKLSSVIRRAGGFTDESFIDGAIFTRESIKEKEREQLRVLGDAIRRDQASRSMTKESEDFSISSSEVEAGISALLSSEVYGRLIIDISSMMQGDSSEDIVLQDGDVLIVPKFTNAVTVVGEVRRSGSFVKQDNLDIEDYLDLAAGMTARGDEEEIYIIRADGSVKKNAGKKSFVRFDDDENQIQAGDTIVVPIKSNYQTPLNLYSTVSQVIFQSIASIAAFSTVFD